MPELTPRVQLEELEQQAEELLRAAQRGDAQAAARLPSTPDGRTLAAAQLALAREHGFDSWDQLETEVERRAVLDRVDVAALRACWRAGRSWRCSG
jgi:hypothetical protein